MQYLFGLFGPWLALTALCGAVVGWRAAVPGGAPARSRIWLALCVLVFASALAAAWMQWLAGRAGLWLEAALLFFAAYGLGCALGALIRRAARRTA